MTVMTVIMNEIRKRRMIVEKAVILTRVGAGVWAAAVAAFVAIFLAAGVVLSLVTTLAV
jgi:hypothetical protein